MSTEAERIDDTVQRRAEHLMVVMNRRRDVIIAERRYTEAVRTARGAGCTDGEITSAQALLERAAR